jgi:methionine synthase II (cobalamin-independent)
VDSASASFDDQMLAFYEEYMAVVGGEKSLTESRFRLDSGTARGFFALLERLKRLPGPPAAVKGQITGPVTFTTGVNDQQGRAIYYDEQLRDAAAKLLSLKAQWQVRELRFAGCPVIVFLDEPALAGFGSSEFISISREDIADLLNAAIAAIHVEGGIAVVHVCANTDWSLLLESAVDIINFDAYAYFDRFRLYPKQIKNFIDSGRIVAWGIVPTLNREDIERESLESLMKAWQAKIESLEGLGIDRGTLLEQSLITPSCGAGSLSVASAEKVLSLTRGLSDRIRSQS